MRTVLIRDRKAGAFVGGSLVRALSEEPRNGAQVHRQGGSSAVATWK